MSDLPPHAALDLEMSEVALCRSEATIPEEAARAAGLVWRPIGSAAAVAASKVDVLMCNRVVGLGVVEPAQASDVDAAVEFYHAAGSPRFMVCLAPGASPPELPSWLEARGFALHNHWIKLWRPCEEPVADGPDPRIRRIGIDHAEAFARSQAEAFQLPETVLPWFGATVGLPDWHHYAAFDGDEPVGFGVLVVLGRVGWLGFAGTKHSHRRQGIQSALIATRVRDAAALGCEIAVVETADDTLEKRNPSTHNLVRMRFRVAYRRPNWVKKLALEIEPEKAAADAIAIEKEVPAA